MGGRAGAGAEATVDQPLPRCDHTVYSRATVMFEAAVIIGEGTDDYAYFVMGGKEERVKNEKSAILLFSSNTDTHMEYNSEPLPAHSMALDTCGSLVSPHGRATNAWGTKNNNQHKQTRENKRTRAHTRTSTWTRVGPWRGPGTATTSMAPL